MSQIKKVKRNATSAITEAALSIFVENQYDYYNTIISITSQQSIISNYNSLILTTYLLYTINNRVDFLDLTFVLFRAWILLQITFRVRAYRPTCRPVYNSGMHPYSLF